MRSINYLWCIKYNKNRLDGFNGGEEVDMVNHTIISSKTLIVDYLRRHCRNMQHKNQEKYLLHKLAASFERCSINNSLQLLKYREENYNQGSCNENIGIENIMFDCKQ
eukprot:187263_1